VEYAAPNRHTYRTVSQMSTALCEHMRLKTQRRQFINAPSRVDVDYRKKLLVNMYPEVLLHYSTQILLESTGDIGRNKKNCELEILMDATCSGYGL